MEKSKLMVILDPGHGSNTPGKRSPKFADGKTQFFEYKFARDVLSLIEKKLDQLGIAHYNAHPEIKEQGTTSKDLCLRVKRANAKYNECKKQGINSIFISIHVNAAGCGQWMTAKGWSAWTSKGQTKGDKLADAIYDAAEIILPKLNKKIRTDKSDGDRDYESNFYVLKYTNCPAVLTENFFMDNKEDATWLITDEAVETVAEIHVQGILNYIKNN